MSESARKHFQSESNNDLLRNINNNAGIAKIINFSSGYNNLVKRRESQHQKNL